MITFETRRESLESIDKNKRYKEILEVLGNNEMTAKEIAVEMRNKGYIPTSERNFVSPRLTEMSIDGRVEPTGKRKCQFTGKTVTTYKKRENVNGNY
jgi:repressor of nif and glnA expression